MEAATTREGEHRLHYLATGGHYALLRIGQVRAELEDRGLCFPLAFYLGEEWFTPDGSAAVAIPFYLAHPRLERLERTQMLDVEGGEETEEVEASADTEVAERHKEMTEDVDSLLDEIDEVLEENSEEFVRQYVQKGGQ